MPVLGEQNPYHTAWAAVVCSAWYCGLGPSIVTVLLEVIGIWYWFLLPSPSIQLANPRAENSGMLGFLAFSGFIIALGEANRRSLSRAQLGEEGVRKSHAELEQKVHERMAELRIANENLRELSGRLQQLRDEERRQIARELHDSVGQMLAALAMNIGIIQTLAPKLDPAAARTVSDSAGLVEQISREIRTISYLLHPPLLEIAGLLSAMRWYVDGFLCWLSVKWRRDVLR
jgi:signal transduction histidine kinase